MAASKVAAWFLKYRYGLLCALVFGLMVLRTDNSYWVGDFWEHSSVIRELATHPIHPVHPQLLSNSPSAFNTPYHLLLALAVRLSGRSAVEILAAAGIFNLLLFFVGFYLFISVLDRKNRSGLAFYSLLLVLLLWGFYAWNFSGFFHLRNLGFVIPFPSMFAMAISLVALWLNDFRLRKKNDLWLIPIWLIAATVLLTHSITFFFLAAGLAAFSLQVRERLWVELLKVAGISGLAFGLAMLWPYYPFQKLILGESALYHLSNKDMYQHLLLRVWPLLIGIPLLVLETRKDWRNPLTWMFAALLAIYLIGWVTGAYSYGRVVSYLGVILQITIAIYLLKLEYLAGARFRSLPAGQAIFSLGISLALILATLTTQVIPLFETVAPQEGNHLEKYLFLTQYTGQYDVVLTDLPTSMIVPTFGGKVVAYDRPLPFVMDVEQRRADVLRFYDSQTTLEERREILTKYEVKYILLEKKPEDDWEATRARIAQVSELIYRGKRFLLYEVK